MVRLSPRRADEDANDIGGICGGVPKARDTLHYNHPVAPLIEASRWLCLGQEWAA